MRGYPQKKPRKLYKENYIKKKKKKETILNTRKEQKRDRMLRFIELLIYLFIYSLHGANGDKSTHSLKSLLEPLNAQCTMSILSKLFDIL